jgi:hypothetical protein
MSAAIVRLGVIDYTRPNEVNNGASGVTLAANVEAEVARFSVPSGQRAWIQIGVTVAALTNLRLARAPIKGGTQDTLVTTTGWAAIATAGGTVVVLDLSNSAPNTLAAGSDVQMQIGPGPEYVLYATSAGAAVVTVVGTIG